MQLIGNKVSGWIELTKVVFDEEASPRKIHIIKRKIKPKTIPGIYIYTYILLKI